MRVGIIILLIASFVWGVTYNVTPSNSRRSDGGMYQRGGKIPTQVIPNKNYNQQKSKLGVNVAPIEQNQNKYHSPNYSVHSSRNVTSTSNGINVDISSAKTPAKSQTPPLDVRVYPPVGTSDNMNRINVEVGESQPITNEMMFEKTKMYKKRLPPRKVATPPPPPPTPKYIDEYEDDDVEPLFVRNRNGVLIGMGIGGNFERLWLGNATGNLRLYENNFTYYFRMGYQHYFTDFLGVRAYAHLGDWSGEFHHRFFDGERDVVIWAKENVNYNFFAEILYDFLVLPEHSFGLFAGFGFGIGTYELSNDGIDQKKDIFTIPMFSTGFAYTFYENNRFEFEVKTPMRQPVLDISWRGEFSTWMIGVSYTYIF